MNGSERKYHPEVFLPPTFKPPRVACLLKVTSHARQEAWRDGLTLPTALDTSRAVLFEVVVDGAGRPIKYGYRLSYDEQRDICLVLRPERGEWVVITCWSNEKSDNHRTLNKREYSRV